MISVLFQCWRDNSNANFHLALKKGDGCDAECFPIYATPLHGPEILHGDRQLWVEGEALQPEGEVTLLGSGEGPDWDANLMSPATRLVGIATHLMLGLRGLPTPQICCPPTPQICCSCSHASPSPGPSSPMRAAGALSEVRVGTQQLLLLSRSPSTYPVPNLTCCFSCVSAVFSGGHFQLSLWCMTNTYLQNR